MNDQHMVLVQDLDAGYEFKGDLIPFVSAYGPFRSKELATKAAYELATIEMETRIREGERPKKIIDLSLDGMYVYPGRFKKAFRIVKLRKGTAIKRPY